MRRVLLCGLLLIAPTACLSEPVERQFFKGDIPSRIERLEAFPLDQQWNIFRYGNQVIHPPATSLALPIAKRGKPAVVYILGQLEQSENDLDFRDSLVVFQTMQWGNHYDVCGDDAAIQAIRDNQQKIRHPDWRAVYGQLLGGLCDR